MTLLPEQDLVLIGAGHTHLHILKMWRMRPIAGVQLTVVSPFSRATYSGMLPGTLAGLYGPDDMEIDLYRLAHSCRARLIVAEAVGMDPAARQVLLADRPPLRFDVASIGIGSVPGQAELWRGHPRVLSIKPMGTFLARLQHQLDRMQSQPARSARIAVVGAGAGGTEIAFGLAAWLRRRGRTERVTLIDAHDEVLEGYSAGTIRRVRRALAERQIEVVLGRRVQNVNQDGTLEFGDGSQLPADVILWATAAQPAPVLENYALPRAPDGFLEVQATLQTTAALPVFAVGDCATIVDQPLPKAGVYAVRQGPVLWDNLQRIFAGRPLREYRAQRGFLSLLSLGDGEAVLDYRGWSARGRWVWRLKDHIDRKFMRMYQECVPPDESAMKPAPRSARHDSDTSPLPERTAELGASAATVSAGPKTAMRCLGCGGKVGGNVLRDALRRLRVTPDVRTIVGLDQADDAVVLDRERAPVDVLSVDVFEAFLDDPYVVGRVAALHALSDIWAMGAEPLGALAIVGLPEGSRGQQAELLYQLLTGGLRELQAHGAGLWGGHTTHADVISIGFTVSGSLHGQPPFSKRNLRPGDRLVLTKPLGTATLLAGHWLCRARSQWLDELLQTLLSSNAPAVRVARQHALTAATDVTGFGLAGHLLEMLEASGVSARVSLQSLPLLAGFAELSAAGVQGSLAPDNAASANRQLVARPELYNLPAWHALFDPQTSGGLLLGVPVDRTRAVLADLQAAGVSGAVIGEVCSSTGATGVLELIE